MDNEMKKDVEIAEQDQEQPKEEKLFTRAEVNELIKRRLKRAEDSSAKKEDAALLEAQTQLEARERELQRKESFLQCKEYLITENLPTDLLEAVDTSDFEQFENKIGIVQRYVRKNSPTAPLGSSEPIITHSAPGAFSPDYKHKPKDPFRGDY